MDAGLAAVLGALAGSVATIGAALATGWAQRESARITVRSEHRRERREPRHGVYKEFISEASRMCDEVGIFATYDMFPPDLVTENRAQRIEGAADSVKEKWVEVALAGPREVAEVASKIERLSNGLAFRIRAYQRAASTGMMERIKLEAVEIEESLDRLVFLAQAALDDDGSLS
ncbi:hypothetical protein ACWD46_17045 [Streptomyces sp. NPDC002486]